MKTYIDFYEIESKGKTKKWTILNKDNSSNLGYISWYGAWRRYCFFPNQLTIFEQTCLRDIANFIEIQTKLYNDNRRIKN